MKKRIFVTGAAGFVGSYLVPMLINAGFKVTILIRLKKESKILPGGVKVIVADLSKKGPWQNKLKGHDVLIHLAAEISSTDPNMFEKNNVVATTNLIKAAKYAKIKKIILFSSAAVTSIRKDLYAQTKEKQEKIVIGSKINYLILRPSMIYGPGDTKNIGWLINLIKKLPAVPLPGGGHFGRQPIFIDDIARIVVKLVRGNYANKIFEIHGCEYVPMSKMVKVILKKSNKFRIIFPVPLHFLVGAFWLGEKLLPNPKFTTDQISSLISGEKFSGDKWWEIFDIIPTSFEAGVEKMISQK